MLLAEVFGRELDDMVSRCGDPCGTDWRYGCRDLYQMSRFASKDGELDGFGLASLKGIRRQGRQVDSKKRHSVWQLPTCKQLTQARRQVLPSCTADVIRRRVGMRRSGPHQAGA
jgi:hypothetical protein